MKLKTLNKTLPEQGFTLIEAIISASVFATAVTSIVGVYLSIERINQKSLGEQALEQNSRFVVEDITKIIRNGQIDYPSYIANYGAAGALQPGTTDLFLLDKDGMEVHIFPQGTDLMISKNGGTAVRYHSDLVGVLDFKAYLWPPLDPFLAGAAVREQPTVTIYFIMRTQATPKDLINYPYQFTVATKEYTEPQ